MPADSRAHPALKLLERSIRSGDSELALIRLLDAVKAGAYPVPAQWRFCDAAVARQPHAEALFLKAADLAHQQARRQ